MRIVLSEREQERMVDFCKAMQNCCTFEGDKNEVADFFNKYNLLDTTIEIEEDLVINALKGSAFILNECEESVRELDMAHTFCKGEYNAIGKEIVLSLVDIMTENNDRKRLMSATLAVWAKIRKAYKRLVNITKWNITNTKADVATEEKVEEWGVL